MLDTPVIHDVASLPDDPVREGCATSGPPAILSLPETVKFPFSPEAQ